MDNILDTLLQSLRNLVPHESAQILLHESDSRLCVSRQAPRPDPTKQVTKYPLTLDAGGLPLVKKVPVNQCGVFVADTKLEQEWRTIKGSGQPRSWLGVPLIASHQTLGLLSLGHSAPGTFTQEHLRLAESLDIPAAAAIQNARLYECARICGTELEKKRLLSSAGKGSYGKG